VLDGGDFAMGPQRIGVNVFGDDGLASIGGGATGTRAGADAHTESVLSVG